MNIAKALLVILFLSGASACTVTGPNIPADELPLKASKELESGEQQEALQKLQAVEARDADLAPDFAFRYGKILVEDGTDAEAWRKGRSLLAGFVADAGWESEHYNQALEMLLAVEAKLDAAEQPARFEDRLPEILEAVNAQMVRIEGGSFSMGCTPEQENCGRDEEPVHEVLMGTYEIGKFEVTQELWEAVMGEAPSAFAGCPRCPVETVSWDDVQMFIQKLNSGGGSFRLPTEAEWEYASRGGLLSRGYQYSGSDDWAEVAWFYTNADNRTHTIGQKKPNELGLFDMSGNVREWVQDCWHDSYAGAPNDGQPWEEEDCDRRVIRSGSWYGKPSYVRSANRFWYTTNFRNNNLGFRLALTPEE